MKTITYIFLIAILSYIAHLYIPIWWLFAIISFAVSFAFSKDAWSAFYTGFLAIFGLWFFLFIFGSVNNDFLLVNKMTALIGLPHSSLLILLSTVIGGLVSGLASLSGYFLKTYSHIPSKKIIATEIETVETEVLND